MKNILVILAIMSLNGCIMKANEIDIDPEFELMKSMVLDKGNGNRRLL